MKQLLFLTTLFSLFATPTFAFTTSRKELANQALRLARLAKNKKRVEKEQARSLGEVIRKIDRVSANPTPYPYPVPTSTKSVADWSLKFSRLVPKLDLSLSEIDMLGNHFQRAIDIVSANPTPHP